MGLRKSQLEHIMQELREIKEGEGKFGSVGSRPQFTRFGETPSDSQSDLGTSISVFVSLEKSSADINVVGKLSAQTDKLSKCGKAIGISQVQISSSERCTIDPPELFFRESHASGESDVGVFFQSTQGQ